MYGLPKAERLCSRKQIAGLMEEGSVLFHFPFKIFFALQPAVAGEPCCRMTVSVPKRNFKRAVKRNLLKRRIREAFRLNKMIFYTTLQQKNKQAAVFFHYVSPEILPYDHIEPNMQKAFAKLASMLQDSVDVPAASVG